MKLLSFLRSCRQDLWNKRVKLIRHADANYDLDELVRAGFFDEYQSRQGSDVFNCDYIAGVYLIVDGTNGQQYIGSAYGDSGILGRWRGYVGSKHGGNKRLRALLEEDPQRYSAFSCSILRTLSRSLTSKEVIKIEGDYKKKLGTRAFGLNEN